MVIEVVPFFPIIVAVYAGYHLLMSIAIEKVKQRNGDRGIE